MAEQQTPQTYPEPPIMGPPRPPENRFIANLLVNGQPVTKALVFGGTLAKVSIERARERLMSETYMPGTTVEVVDIREATEAETGRAPALPKISDGQVVGATPILTSAMPHE